MPRPRQSVIEYRRYDFPDDFPVQIHQRMNWKISSVRSNRLHIHNCFEIGLCLSGSGKMNFGEEEVPFRAGDVLFVARNVPHTTWSNPGDESVWKYIHLDPERVMGEVAPDKPPRPREMIRMFTDCHLILPSSSSPWAARAAESIMAEMAEKAPGYEAVVYGLCEAMFYRLLRVYPKEGDQPGGARFRSSGLTPALEYMHRNYMNSFPMETLAELCHMSPTHFRRRFQQQLGTNPLSYLHQVRMMESRDLLRNTDLPIVEISEMVGYQSLSCFNRHFFGFNGCTPSQWRKQRGEGRKTATVGLSGWERPETSDEIEFHNLQDSRSL